MISKQATFERIIFIHLAGEDQPIPAGLFSLDIDTGIGRFSYGRRYLTRPTAIAIDPINLPLSKQEYVTRNNHGIFGVLLDILPDSWGKSILAKHLKIPFASLKAFEMFDYSTTNAVGALSLGTTPNQPAMIQGNPVQPGELHEVATVFEKAMTDRQVPADSQYLLGIGTSMGGTQPKCPVLYDNEEWIAKFENSGDRIKLPRLEFGTMLMAKKAGINVPDINLGEVAGNSVYMSKRFDRHRGTRIPYISANALTNLDSNEFAHGSYMEVARHMRKFVANVTLDLQELYRRMVFNVFIRNQNDHLSNHGFIYRENGWHLSPAYGVLPSFAPETADHYSLSLDIGLEGTISTISNLYSCHQEFNLSRRQAEKIVAEVDAATADWRETLKECNVPKEDIEEIRWSFEGFKELSEGLENKSGILNWKQAKSKVLNWGKNRINFL